MCVPKHVHNCADLYLTHRCEMCCLHGWEGVTVEGGTGQLLSHSSCEQMFFLSLLKDRSPPAKAQGSLLRKRGELGPGSMGGEGGHLACFYKMNLAVTSAGYLVHSPPLEREQDTLKLRDGSTQHVRGKQFIFLPQLLTGGNIKCH